MPRSWAHALPRMVRGMSLLRFAFSLLLVASCGGAQDLVLRGVHVWTGSDEPWPDDQLVVVDGRIQPPHAPVPEGATLVELRGAFVFPGLHDAHAHLRGLGESLRSVDLVGTRSYAEVIERVAARAKTTPKGDWILGRGWDQNDWPVAAFPEHAELSRAVPDHPVFLVRVDGHAALANRRALELAGVSAATAAPAGGEVHRDAQGEPTGVLIDHATALVGGQIPDASPAQLEAALLAAHDACVRHGLTCVHDAGMGELELGVVRALIVAGRWRLRVHAMLPADELAAIERGPWQTPDGTLVVRAVKAYADGALGSRGAALLAPYSDQPGTRGLLLTPKARLEQIARLCVARGFQLCTHAIGDAANRAVLDAYAAAVPEAERARVRFRIEHAQVVHADDFARFAAQHVIPSMQPTHLTSDMPWAPQRLGADRIDGAYAWTRFLGLGLRLPLGSDFPVESVDPRLGFYAAITTKAPDGSGPPEGFRPSGVLDRRTALKGFTADAAYAAFAERELGTIEPGKRADFTILDRDLATCAPERVLDARVLATVIGGRIVHRAEAR